MIKKFESYNAGREVRKSKFVYWLTAMDDRLEDALVNLHKQYTEWQTPVKPVAEASELANWIRSLYKGYFIYIILEIIENRDGSLTPKFDAKDYTTKCKEQMDKEGYLYLGKINVEDYELEADKYNL